MSTTLAQDGRSANTSEADEHLAPPQSSSTAPPKDGRHTSTTSNAGSHASTTSKAPIAVTSSSPKPALPTSFGVLGNVHPEASLGRYFTFEWSQAQLSFAGNLASGGLYGVSQMRGASQVWAGLVKVWHSKKGPGNAYGRRDPPSEVAGGQWLVGDSIKLEADLQVALPTTQSPAEAFKLDRPVNATGRCGCRSGTDEELPKFITMLSKQKLDAKFCRCALVGSAAGFANRGYGAEIDGHDTVIRINRLPNDADDFRDFGRRTDIFWGEPGFGAPGYHTNLNGKGQYWVEHLHKTWAEAKSCTLADASGSCNFRNLILKGSDIPVVRLTFRQRFPLGSPGQFPDRFGLPFGHQSDDINLAAFSIDEMKHIPTNGLHALVTFAPLCGTFTLYGFDGGGTSDGHPIGDRHSLSEERQVMDRLARGEVRGTDFEKSSKPLAEVMRQRLKSLGQFGCMRRVRLPPKLI